MIRSRIVSPLITGTLLGFLAAQALYLGWWTLVPWGIAGLILGYRCMKGSDAMWSGLLYGFVLVLIFLIAQYTGEVSVIRRLPAFALLAMFGAACGLLLTFAGFAVRRWPL